MEKRGEYAPMGGKTMHGARKRPQQILDAKDVLRMGNFNLLGDMGGNVALEFLGGPHSLLSRMHLSNQRALNSGLNP